MINQLNLFDLEKYSSPSTEGKPDWFYDTVEGDELEPSETRKEDNSPLEQTDRQGVEPAKPLPISISLPLTQINQSQKITGDRNSTPGEEINPGAIVSPSSGGGNLEATAKGDRHISTALHAGEKLDSTGDGDLHITGDRTGGKQDSENLGMLGNTDRDRSCSIASDSTPLTVEEGRAIWDNLIFGRETIIPERVALETSGDYADRNLGRSNHKRVQSDDFTPDMVVMEAADNAISSENFQLTDQRRHNGKPGASGWIGVQFKYRDPLGKSKTSTQWIPGCTGPYYHYQWREGDQVCTLYLPRKKLEAVENAIARRESVNAILMMLG